MQPLQIFMRCDLNMRTGKMAAQAGHAGMLLLVSRFRNEPEHLRMSAADVSDLRALLSTPHAESVLISGQNDLMEAAADARHSQIIIDNGATEFKGQKTLTCASAGIFEDPILQESIAVADSGLKSTALQYFVFSRESSFEKKTASSMAAIGSIMAIEALLVDDPQGSGDGLLLRTGNERFFKWILNGYPKIGLQAPTNDDLVGLQARLNGERLSSTLIEYEGHMMLCIGPEYAADLSPFTSQFKLL
jgi:peptidyl-tRNA hydrolase